MPTKITKLDLIEDDLDIIEDPDTDDCISLDSIPKPIMEPRKPRKRPKKKLPKSKFKLALEKLASSKRFRAKNPFGYDKKLDDDFYLHPKELETRCIKVCLGFAVFFSIYASIMLCILCYLRFSITNPVVILPEIHNETKSRGWPSVHLALIYEDGNVFDQSLSNQPTLSEYKTLDTPTKFLFKLPKDFSDMYFGYSQLDTFYVIPGSIKRKITEYNRLRGHRVIPNSVLEGRFDQSKFLKGIQVGSMFWIWDQDKNSKSHINLAPSILSGCYGVLAGDDFCRRTFLWYTKRTQWSLGPNLPDYLRRNWDALGINRTSMILIGMKKTKLASNKLRINSPITLLYDFERSSGSKWLEYPALDLQPKQTDLISISLATVLEKKSRKVFAGFTYFKYCPSLNESLAYMSIQSYDLSFQQYGKWETLTTYQIPKLQKKPLQIYSFRGELYSTSSLQDISSYMLGNSILDQNGDPKYLVSVIPYIVYE